jgi:hypothetical protein
MENKKVLCSILCKKIPLLAEMNWMQHDASDSRICYLLNGMTNEQRPGPIKVLARANKKIPW